VRASAEDLLLGHVCLHVGSTFYRQSNDCTTGTAGLDGSLSSSLQNEFAFSAPKSGSRVVRPGARPGPNRPARNGIFGRRDRATEFALNGLRPSTPLVSRSYRRIRMISTRISRLPIPKSMSKQGGPHEIPSASRPRRGQAH
jgi:hypothetical protein